MPRLQNSLELFSSSPARVLFSGGLSFAVVYRAMDVRLRGAKQEGGGSARHVHRGRTRRHLHTDSRLVCSSLSKTKTFGGQRGQSPQRARDARRVGGHGARRIDDIDARTSGRIAVLGLIGQGLARNHARGSRSRPDHRLGSGSACPRRRSPPCGVTVDQLVKVEPILECRRCARRAALAACL
jgi:hypothetical protein